MKRLAGLAAAAVCCLGLVYLSGSAGAQTVPGAPTVASVTAGAGSLTVTWTAPVSDGGSPVVSYDVRHIETGAVDRTDGNWTVEEGVWTSGDLSHTVTRLTDGVAYDIEVRAANTTDPGTWSATASGTTRDHPDRQSAATIPGPTSKRVSGSKTTTPAGNRPPPWFSARRCRDGSTPPTTRTSSRS